MSGQKRCQALLKEYGATIALTASLLGFSLWLYLGYEWSPLRLPEKSWSDKLNLHLTWAPFAIRYFQSYSTLALHRLFGWPVKESFFIIQYGLALILGLVMHRYLRRLGFSLSWTHVGLFLTFTAYPILGAHFEPTHTWDDFWAYLFLVLALTAALDGRLTATTVWLTLGIFAREQTVFFSPVIFITLWHQQDKTHLTRLYLLTALPLVLYGLFRLWKWDPINARRWKQAAFNFSDAAVTQDSLVSVIISFGIMWLLALTGLWLISKVADKNQQIMLRWGAGTAVPLTMAAGLLVAFARETRIMFPPFVIIVPLTLLTLRAGWQRISSYRWLWLIGLAVALGPAIWFGLDLADMMFPKFDYGANAVFRRDVAGIHFGLAIVFLICLSLAGISRLWTQPPINIRKKAAPETGAA